MKTRATFIEPMLLLSTEKLPQGPDWLYEIRLDGYRALATKTGGRVQLRSRNNSDGSARYAPITAALRELPDETVVDGEVVALDEEGRPSLYLLQNFPTSRAHLAFFVFDVLILQGRDVTGETLEKRRRLLEKHILARLTEPIHYSPELKANLADLVHSVKLQGLEGLVAKRRSSPYEPGRKAGIHRRTATSTH